MTPEVRAELQARFGPAVRFDVPLSRFTTYRIGGPAAAVVEVEVEGREMVEAAVRTARDLALPWLPLGLGSNVLAPDAGLDALVIRLGKGLAGGERAGPEGTRWTVGAGLATPLLARRTARAGLSGVHRLVGVPGTVGGGVWMNAGAHGQEFKDVVQRVEVVTPAGETESRRGDAIPWGYRSSGIEGIVVAAVLELTPGDPTAIRRDVERHLTWRKTGTPFDQPCCGSVFRNPLPEDVTDAMRALGEPYTAGRLIDAAGMKGYRHGGAEVSPMHANYVVNTRDATAADVRQVIGTVQKRVEEAFGVRLGCEVRFLENAVLGVTNG